MTNLNQQCQEIYDWFASKNIDVDVFKEHPVGEPKNVIRGYISSKALGGLLAQSIDDLWIPVYPEKPNYPMKHKWYGSTKFKTDWKTAIKAALFPERFLKKVDETGFKTAIDRAGKLRSHIQSAVLCAILEDKYEIPDFKI